MAPDRTSFAPPDARRLGAILLALLVLLAVPGVALALKYAPDPARAHDAVEAVAASARGAARGVHAWAASLVLALVALHVARAYAAGRLHVPSRAATLAGLGALAVLVGAFFTGTILPWDQQGWEAMQHLRAGAGAVGADVGSDDPDAAPLRAVFYAHVFAVPVALALLVLLHLWRRAPPGAAKRLWVLLRAARAPIAVLAVIVIALGIALPPVLGPAPIRGLAITRPDWPFLWLVPLQDAFGPAGLLALPLAFLVGAAALFAPVPRPRARLALVAAVGLLWGVLTFLGMRA